MSRAYAPDDRVTPDEVPTVESRRWVLVAVVSMVIAAVSIIAAAIALAASSGKRTAVIGVDNAWRLIPVVPLDQPLLSEPRISAFAEECIRASFAHDNIHFKTTVRLAQACYTADAGRLYAEAMDPLLADLVKRRMVMSATIEIPPAIVRVYKRGGVIGWELEARVVLSRDGTRERVAPVPYTVVLHVTRASLEESPRGVLISFISFKPVA